MRNAISLATSICRRQSRRKECKLRPSLFPVDAVTVHFYVTDCTTRRRLHVGQVIDIPALAGFEPVKTEKRVGGRLSPKGFLLDPLTRPKHRLSYGQTVEENRFRIAVV